MFGLIGAILIVLWLVGFFAFHVTALVHVALVVGLILLVLHFMGRSTLSPRFADEFGGVINSGAEEKVLVEGIEGTSQEQGVRLPSPGIRFG
jgi:hypothetical protein